MITDDINQFRLTVIDMIILFLKITRVILALPAFIRTLMVKTTVGQFDPTTLSKLIQITGILVINV